MEKYYSYQAAEDAVKLAIIMQPDFITKSTLEKVNLSFTVLNILENRNNRSNYEYAEQFFAWILTGEKQIPDTLVALNPWVKRFVDTTGLPDNFSSSYGWKIMNQLTIVFSELIKNRDSRRAYINILHPEDDVIRITKTTHEYPCTIGLHFMIRDGALHLVVNMRSNNCFSVMPYDVYNFTCLQMYLADKLEIPYGYYHHQMNSAHIYLGDARRLNQ